MYGVGALQFYNNIGTKEEAKTEGEVYNEKEKRLLVLITSDRGLCGSVHSAIVKV